MDIARRSFDRQWLVADNRVLDRPRVELWEAALRKGQFFLNQQSTHVIDSGAAVVATALIPDTDHFNGRGGRNIPILHPDGSANVAAGLLEYLARELGFESVTVQDLAAYTMAVAGHTVFTEHFSEELLTPGVRLPITRNRDIWQRAVSIGAEVLWASTYGARYADPENGRPTGAVEFPQNDSRQIRYLTHIGVAVPEKPRYDAEAQTLHVGLGSFNPVPEDVWTFEVGGKQVLRTWFGYRKASPNNKKTSPLDDIHVPSWPSEWTTELLELLSTLRRLVDLVPVQRDLLAEILAGPVVTEAELKAAGVFPVTDAARNMRRNIAEGLFAEQDGDA
ncbi:type ISP restriction/modification enzyme [Streptomyces cinereoruber]|uniref:type ISP restriction/modification enzyme n=1 Tax=Streptomyces cinereoruber TaxID=67260 RepID=UPI003633E3C4